MATYNSNIAAIQAERGTSPEMLLPSTYYGRVRVAAGIVTPDEAWPAGSVIRLAKLPKGARLLSQSQIHFEAGQNASLTVKVGDEKDDARYFAAASPGAAAVSKNLDANKLGNYVCEAETYLILTTGAAALAAGKKITFELYFVLD